MPHDPLSRLLFKVFLSSVREKEEAMRLWQARQESRRRFLKEAGLAAGSLLLAPVLRSFGSPYTPPSANVVIVGAGMAGLHAAWLLKQQGIPSVIYEASARTGGRMFTMKDVFGEGLTTDIGGEFVDSTHKDILDLVKQLGLECYDLRTDTLIPKTFYFEGRLLGEKDLREAIAPYVDRLMQDIHSLPPAISYKTADSFRSFDQQSILEYLTSLGIGGWLLAFLNVVLTREYGMEASEQSAINFLIMFEPPLSEEKDYELFGQDHEIFKIKGGSQHLSDTLYQQVKEQVVFRHSLTAIREIKSPAAGHPLSPHEYELLFDHQPQPDQPARPVRIKATHVILALPFTILRTINLQIPVPPEKKKCIDEIGYGNSCKFIMGMKERTWRAAGRQGYTFTDRSFGCGWDSSQSQPGDAGSFTVFGGGHFGDEVQKATEDSLTRQFLPDLDAIYKGSAAAHNEKKIKFCWAGNPYSKAGYSSFKKGQWSTLAGWEGVPVGNIWFAGEHVSREFQGYMNGAAETGRVAATAVAASIQQVVAATAHPLPQTTDNPSPCPPAATTHSEHSTFAYHA